MKGVTALDLENNWIKETSFINSQIKKSGEKALSDIVTEVLGIFTSKKKWISLAYVFAALTVTEKRKNSDETNKILQKDSILKMIKR